MVVVTIFHQDSEHKATFRISKIGIRKGIHSAIKLEAVSEFARQSRRSSVRISKELPVKIYRYKNNPTDLFMGDLVCDATAVDLSREGVSINADYDLNTFGDALFTVVFSVSFRVFTIPIQLMRVKKIENRAGVSYNFGFRFDFKDLPEEQDKLVVEIFKSKINASQG